MTAKLKQLLYPQDVEKLAPKKGVISQSVKEVLQVLTAYMLRHLPLYGCHTVAVGSLFVL